MSKTYKPQPQPQPQPKPQPQPQPQLNLSLAQLQPQLFCVYSLHTGSDTIFLEIYYQGIHSQPCMPSIVAVQK